MYLFMKDFVFLNWVWESVTSLSTYINFSGHWDPWSQEDSSAVPVWTVDCSRKEQMNRFGIYLVAVTSSTDAFAAFCFVSKVLVYCI